ncbi:MAG: hypothetical protein NTX50_15170 [Candidatus Sumerlaeota bacterium]|nr:hypothetical protein [Candidatus Sumerlaeota bacterium]
MIKAISLSLACLLITGCVMVPIPYRGYPHNTIKGIVVDESSGKPVAGADVIFEFVSHERHRVSIQTKDDGSFLIQPKREWAFYYKIFTMEEFFGAGNPMIINKQGYETSGFWWSYFQHHEWCWNYRIFNRTDNLGIIKLKAASEPTVVVHRVGRALFGSARIEQIARLKKGQDASGCFAPYEGWMSLTKPETDEPISSCNSQTQHD